MANTNTIKTQIIGVVQNNLQPLTNAVAGTTPTAFSLLPGPVSLAGGGVIPLTPTANSQSATWFGTSKKLKIRATGSTVTGTTLNFSLKLYFSGPGLGHCRRRADQPDLYRLESSSRPQPRALSTPRPPTGSLRPKSS